MSYTILYRSMFVKLRNNKYIPLVEIGSNNCYDSIGKRTRSWQQWLIEGREKEYSFTREEIMQAIESWIEREKKCHVNKPKHGNNTEYWTFKDIEKHFGYFGCCALYGRRPGSQCWNKERGRCQDTCGDGGGSSCLRPGHGDRLGW